jgi:hypothetical protein
MRRGIWLTIGAAFALFALAYFGSPFWAARQFKEAALSADVDQLEASVDFPAVRESLKSQLAIALTKKMQSDQELRSNPFAGLGLMMMPAVIGTMVDAFVTPDGMSAMMKSGKVVENRSDGSTARKVDYEYGYRNLDRFVVTAKAADAKKNEAPRFVFERRGIFSWKLIRIEIPAAVFAQQRDR